MSGAAISSTTHRLQIFPQKSVNQRPTTALLSSCKLMECLSIVEWRSAAISVDLGTFVICLRHGRTPVLTPVSNLKVKADLTARLGSAFGLNYRRQFESKERSADGGPRRHNRSSNAIIPDSPDGLGRQDRRPRKCWRNRRLLL